ncbi:hypothetical protein DFO77_1201, partial [Marinilabilia salmonicolor]
RKISVSLYKEVLLDTLKILIIQDIFRNNPLFFMNYSG